MIPAILRHLSFAVAGTITIASAVQAADHWTLFTTPDSPPVHSGHSAVYDPVRQRMLVFGGDGTSDVWSLALSGSPGWSVLAAAGTQPTPHSTQSMVYDSARDRLIVFGGSTGSGAPVADVWALTLSGTPTWSQLVPAGTAPAARSQHAAIYDPVGDRMIVMGGIDMGPCSPNATEFGDVWELRLSPTPAWNPLTVAGTPPAGRHGHAAVYDPVRRCMIVTGGSSGGFCWCNCGTIYPQVWALSLDGPPAWTALATYHNGLYNYNDYRYWHSSVYDPIADRVLSYGGTTLNGNLLRDDVCAFVLPTSADLLLAPEAPVPSQRMNHSAVFDPVGNRMVVFGGYVEGAGATNQTWALMLDPPAAAVPVPGPARLALGRPWPNPSRGAFTVAFTLPDARPARIALYDLAGRELRSAAVGALGAGAHEWRPSESARLQPGMYLVRLTRGTQAVLTRVVVTI